MDVSLIPRLAATGLGDALPDDRIITVRTRLLEAGNRASELVSTGTRMVLGASGTLGAWDYDAGLNHSINKVSDRDVRGYLLYDQRDGRLRQRRHQPLRPVQRSRADGCWQPRR